VEAAPLRLDQRISARGGLDGAPLAQDLGPGFARDLQEFERELPCVEVSGTSP